MRGAPGTGRLRLSIGISVISAMMVLASFLFAARPVAARSMAQAGTTATPTPPAATPTPIVGPEFKILAVRAENNGGKPDWNFTHRAVTGVEVGTPVTLSIYVKFTSLPYGTSVAITLPVTLNGHIVHQSGLNDTVDSSAGGNLWEHTTFTPDQNGKYSASAIVTVNGVTKKATTSFTASTKPKRSYPFWFSFDSLRSYNSRGSATTAFTGGDRVAIVASWTAHNLSQPSPAWVTETLEYPAGNVWRPLGQPLQNSFDTANGSQSYRFTFVPGAAYTSLRIIIRLGIAGKRQQRLVTIQLRG